MTIEKMKKALKKINWIEMNWLNVLSICFKKSLKSADHRHNYLTRSKYFQKNI